MRTNPLRFFSFFGVAAALLLVGCGDDVTTPPDQTGRDASFNFDAGSDAGTDGGSNPDGGANPNGLPEATIVTPANNAFLTSNKPTFTIAVAKAKAESVEVSITDGSGKTVKLPATEGESNTWSVIPATALEDGVGSATAIAVNEDGEKGPVSPTVSFTIDTRIPSAPTITSPKSQDVVQSATPTILVDSGGTTHDVTVTVTDSKNATSTLTAINVGLGKWSATPAQALPTGATTITAVATDSLGGSSPASAPVTFVVDPDVPVLEIVSPADGQVVPVTTPEITVEVLSGTASSVSIVVTDESGSPVTLTATSKGNGLWTATPAVALVPGDVKVVAGGISPAGNDGPTATWQFTVDPNIPEVSITSPAAAEIVTSATPKVQVVVGTPFVTAVTVEFVDSGTAATSVNAVDKGNGLWEATPSSNLPAGDVTITATATNNLGTDTVSDPVTFKIDLTAPAAPVVQSPASGAFVGTATPTFVVASGPTSASLTVSVTDSANATQTLTAINNGNGIWSATATKALAAGAATVSAIAKSAIGGASPKSATVSFTVDLAIPAAPVITAPTAAQVVTTARPSFTVSADSNAKAVAITVVPSNNATLSFGAASNGDGTWSAIAPSDLALGTAKVTSVALSQLGGSSPVSAQVSFVVDTIIPSLELTAPTGDDLVSILKPTFVATVAKGVPTSVVFSVVDSAGSLSFLNATNTGNNTWSAAATTNLPFGPTVITIVGTNYLGNSGAPSDPSAIYVRGCLSADGLTYGSCPAGTDSKTVFLNQANNSLRYPFDNTTRIPSAYMPGGVLPPL